ncbi:MAG: [FeFe] hydrogenase, group A [Candidatus Diapherotrites archaeon]|nr:[FeFe] hydrogenase, group A [Candidatus Diapherotrites archaeon]
MQITIDGKILEFHKGQTILDIARTNKIEIPTLCYHKMLKPEGRCRVCLVEANSKIVTACDTLAEDNMQVVTTSERIRRLRLEALNLIASTVPKETLRKENELTKTMRLVGFKKPTYKHNIVKDKDKSSAAIWKSMDECIVCGRCVQACSKMQTVNALSYMGRGYSTIVVGSENQPLKDTTCVSCGQCSLFCPTDAITEASDISKVEKALRLKSKIKVVQVAPSVRVSVGEFFGLEPGTIVTGQIVASLKKLGFDAVFDTNLSADLTIVEEAKEFVDRFKKGNLPMFTSCCPAWIDFCCEFYPEFINKLSNTKSPQMMLGALIKTYYAKRLGLKPSDIISVSIMPCTAKKREAKLKNINASNVKDIDYVLTTRELGQWLKSKKINPAKLLPAEFDCPLGESTGGGALFGVTGGVMEAALRTAYFYIKGEEMKDPKIEPIRGTKSLREFEVNIGKNKVKGAVAHTLERAREIIERIKKGESFDFVEVMACPGGCIGGGGQPKPVDWEAIEKRAKAIYSIDENKKIRLCHQNPDLKRVYETFLQKPGSKKAKALLHRKYPKRGKPQQQD